jgi:hypothetical protein
MSKPYEVAILERIINNLYDSYPELKLDDDLRLDMLEGSTTFVETIDRLLRKIKDDHHLSNAASIAIIEIKERRDRFDRRVEFNREVIRQLMEMADIRKLELALGTISLSNKPKSVIITNEGAIPTDYFRIKYEANKTAIKAALEAGETIEGATLSNGGTTIQIR